MINGYVKLPYFLYLGFFCWLYVHHCTLFWHYWFIRHWALILICPISEVYSWGILPHWYNTLPEILLTILYSLKINCSMIFCIWIYFMFSAALQNLLILQKNISYWIIFFILWMFVFISFSRALFQQWVEYFSLKFHVLYPQLLLIINTYKQYAHLCA